MLVPYKNVSDTFTRQLVEVRQLAASLLHSTTAQRLTAGQEQEGEHQRARSLHPRHRRLLSKRRCAHCSSYYLFCWSAFLCFPKPFYNIKVHLFPVGRSENRRSDMYVYLLAAGTIDDYHDFKRCRESINGRRVKRRENAFKNPLRTGTPRSVRFADVFRQLEEVDGVRKVHNLRVWALTLDKVSAFVAFYDLSNITHDIVGTCIRSVVLLTLFFFFLPLRSPFRHTWQLIQAPMRNRSCATHQWC